MRIKNKCRKKEINKSFNKLQKILKKLKKKRNSIWNNLRTLKIELSIYIKSNFKNSEARNIKIQSQFENLKTY